MFQFAFYKSVQFHCVSIYKHNANGESCEEIALGKHTHTHRHAQMNNRNWSNEWRSKLLDWLSHQNGQLHLSIRETWRQVKLELSGVEKALWIYKPLNRYHFFDSIENRFDLFRFIFCIFLFCSALTPNGVTKLSSAAAMREQKPNQTRNKKKKQFLIMKFVNIWLPCWYPNDLHIVYLFGLKRRQKRNELKISIKKKRNHYQPHTIQLRNLLLCFVCKSCENRTVNRKQMPKELSENSIWWWIEHDANIT